MMTSLAIEQRIERVIQQLLPETAFEGKYSAPQPLAERMAQLHTPGVSIAVINDYEVEWARGFGIREVGVTSPVTSTTLFQAGSISKPIFALGVMRLVQEGRLDLDEDVNTYLTSWQVPANEGWQPRLTLRQLLSHTAGLTVHGFPGYQTSESLPTVVQILNGEPPVNTDKVEVNILPGLQVRYSGGGTTVAQQAVVDLLGKPFPQLMRDLVLDPFGMTDSTYEQPLPSDWWARAATAHPWKGIPLTGKAHIYPEMAAAGLWTTAHDLAKVGVALLQTLHGRSEGILSEKTIEDMLRPQLPDQKEDEFVGVGFFCKGSGESFHFGHGGWDEGFVALMRLYKESGKGAVVMLNSNEGYPLMEEIMRAIAREYKWPGVFPEEKLVADLAQPDRYEGLYLTETGLSFNVMRQNGTMLLGQAQQSPLPIYPTSDQNFFTPALNTTLTFEADETGLIVALTISQAGKQIKAKKQIG